MQVLLVTPPGRFPTVAQDPGPWWAAMAGTARHSIAQLNLNYWWWRSLCHPDAVTEFAVAHPSPNVLRHVRNMIRLRALAESADVGLQALSAAATYESYPSYLGAVRAVATYLGALNALQDEFDVSLAAGPRVSRLAYDESAAMAAYAQSRSFLARLIKGALRHRSGEPGFIAFKVTSEVELLTGMIAATILRALHPASHISLVDHGYENYSLGPHIARLKETEALEGVFDTIVGSKDDIDVVVPRLIDLVSKGVGPRGFLTRDDVADVRSPPEPNWVPPPAVPIFSPVPVLQTRLSQRRCYWSRCTFCTQNAKYDNPRAPGKSEIRRSVDRLEALVGAGYRNVIFADEALSPATIRIVAEEILARKLDVRWACRCKLERSFSRELLTLAANAGCYEILFGLETTSDALLHKMGKAVDGLNPDGVASIFRDMKQIGLGVHVNLICGFPGETLAEADATVKFVVETLAGHRNATYRLNRFTLFPDTPIFSEPSLFGIAHIQMRGDMPQHFAFELTEDVAAETAPVLRQFDAYSARLANGLGWDEIASNAAGRAALDLYFSSGHGAIFKSLSINPFEAARAATPANPAQMSS